jgi:hypothetical protein
MEMMERENLRGDQQTVAFITETSEDGQDLFDVKRVNDFHIQTDKPKMTHTVFIGETTGLTLPTVLKRTHTFVVDGIRTHHFGIGDLAYGILLNIFF